MLTADPEHVRETMQVVSDELLDRSMVTLRPREMALEDLVALLEKEHEDVRKEMFLISEMLLKGDSDTLSRRLASLDEELMQHMLDEEASVLRVLIQAYGRDGSEEAIEVFREHVEIKRLLDDLRKGIAENQEERMKTRDALDTLLVNHFTKEDETIFPWAIRTHKSRSTGQRTSASV